MLTKSVERPNEIYQINVTLLGSDPPIWRRLLVPSDLTLLQLHHVLQVAMGWDDSHMHEFRIQGQRYGTPDPIEQSFRGPQTIGERTVRLSSVLGRVRSKALYIYDFGDDWQHQILVEKRLAPEPECGYPICIAGERQGPPEDCGGIYRFCELLDALDDPENQDVLDWLGEEYDPEAISIEEINRRLALLWRSPKKPVVGAK